MKLHPIYRPSLVKEIMRTETGQTRKADAIREMATKPYRSFLSRALLCNYAATRTGQTTAFNAPAEHFTQIMLKNKELPFDLLEAHGKKLFGDAERVAKKADRVGKMSTNCCGIPLGNVGGTVPVIHEAGYL